MVQHPIGLGRDMIRRKRVLIAAVLPLVVLVVGTLGYRLIEGWSLSECLYMTVVTVSTVGYQEVHPVSEPGRWFTMALILGSIGTVGYSVTIVAGFLIEGELQRIMKGRRMDKQLTGLSNHIIVCGLGRTGRSVVAELQAHAQPLVVIEDSAERIADLQNLGYAVPTLDGDATEDAVLRRAGIERAKGLITVLSNDRDNVFVVLTARELKPDLHIVARLDEAHNEPKLRAAGANEVVSPNHIGGARMAGLMTRASAMQFSDMLAQAGSSLDVTEVASAQGSPLLGSSLAELQLGHQHRVQVVGRRLVDGSYDFALGPDTRFEPGQTCIVLGDAARVDGFSRWVHAEREALS